MMLKNIHVWHTLSYCWALQWYSAKTEEQREECILSSCKTIQSAETQQKDSHFHILKIKLAIILNVKIAFIMGSYNCLGNEPFGNICVTLHICQAFPFNKIAHFVITGIEDSFIYQSIIHLHIARYSKSVDSTGFIIYCKRQMEGFPTSLSQQNKCHS